ncbi:NTP transferase domain-containing protein [Belliella kenyensis]|uniref:NTP transferase domain-containing protein n=1 Tax=Belliella kenyensis TaxID=1472724 RepID=A0ABV8EK68_9BACT|nr:nucleotidyltransferase family protein [Belliella kenyensis]MCH7400406.1 nucleotidyltransferase family protein [Belliella kenyensis]MDN3604577.1 nucleotidyltransferase family protein [Belliella kenyensis]
MDKFEFQETGVIILAAGNSSRLGSPKQLLTVHNETFLELSIKVAKQSLAKHIMVVLGANRDLIYKKIDLSQIDTVINHSWSDGMTSSIQLGLQHMIDHYHIQRVAIMLCDQPFVTFNILNNLLGIQSEKIGVSRYQDALGVPVSFSKKYFEEIFSLKSKEGAKKIILKHLHNCEILDFELGSIDIDTWQDYEKYIHKL